MSIDKTGAAFPVAQLDGVYAAEYGMTYRQWLAGMIAGHLVVDDSLTSQIAAKVLRDDFVPGTGLKIMGTAIWEIVDAIIDAEAAK